MWLWLTKSPRQFGDCYWDWGQVLVEKLLRSTQVARIFLLIRWEIIKIGRVWKSWKWLFAIQLVWNNLSYHEPMLTFLFVIYDLHRQKRGVPCSDRLEQVGQWISYKGSQQKLLCQWKSTSHNNLRLMSSRNEDAYCWLSDEHYGCC